MAAEESGDDGPVFAGRRDVDRTADLANQAGIDRYFVGEDAAGVLGIVGVGGIFGADGGGA